MTTNLSVVTKCSKCGGEVVARNSAAANLIKGGRSVICDKCRREGRHWTKANYEDYLKTDHWRSFRLRAIKRAANKCQLCASTNRLEVHHNDYSRLGGELMTDVVVLCRSCHSLVHGVLP